jgi:hypothetical protein
LEQKSTGKSIRDYRDVEALKRDTFSKLSFIPFIVGIDAVA